MAFRHLGAGAPLGHPKLTRQRIDARKVRSNPPVGSAFEKNLFDECDGYALLE